MKTRYYDSQFLYRPNADNLYQCINAGSSQLPKQPMIQLSMDGPNTNWKVFEKFNTAREANDDPCLADIGSCSLHIVSGSLNAGVTETSWEIDKIMKSMWKLLSDSPPRRDEYLKLGVSGKFPLKFCATRWVENEDTAERAMLVWPDIILLINHFLSLSKSKQPKNNKSYDRLVKVFKDKLVPLKLMFFKEIAAILNGFLRPFQTDNPMVPFLSDAYEELIRKLMKMFLLGSTGDGAKTPLAVLKIDLNNMDTRLPLSQLRLPTSIKVVHLLAPLIKKIVLKKNVYPL